MCTITNETEKNEWRISKAPLPLSNDSAKYWNVVWKWCMFSCYNTRVPSVIICLMCSLRAVEIELRFLCTLYTSLPWFCIQLDFYAYYMRPLGNSLTLPTIFCFHSLSFRIQLCGVWSHPHPPWPTPEQAGGRHPRGEVCDPIQGPQQEVWCSSGGSVWWACWYYKHGCYQPPHMHQYCH